MCGTVNYFVSNDHRVKLKESESLDKYLGLIKEPKKIMEHEDDNCANCWCTRNDCKKIKGTGNQRKDSEHSENNTNEKS